MGKIIEKDGEKYLIIGDRALLLDSSNKVKVEVEETLHEDGSKDVTVKVPCLKVGNKQNKI